MKVTFPHRKITFQRGLGGKTKASKKKKTYPQNCVEGILFPMTELSWSVTHSETAVGEPGCGEPGGLELGT